MTTLAHLPPQTLPALRAGLLARHVPLADRRLVKLDVWVEPVFQATTDNRQHMDQ